MATDGDSRRGSRPQQAEAKTEALTPERRAELMAAAEAQYRKDSRADARAESQPAVRISTSSNKVEPLEPGVKTESGLHLHPSDSLGSLPAIPPPPDDRTEAISRAELRQHLKNLPSEPSDTDNQRREAGFDETAAGDDPAQEPTLPPQLEPPGSDPAFEADATVAYMSDGSLPSAAPNQAREPAPDRTANDLPMPTLTAPPHPPESAPPPSAPPEPPLPDELSLEPAEDGPSQPGWLGNARPVDLQRPASGAPSEFGDVATGLGPAPLPDDEEGEAGADGAAGAEANERAATEPVDSAAPATPKKGCGAAIAILALFALVGTAAGGTVAAFLWGPQLLTALGMSDDDDKKDPPDDADPNAAGAGTNNDPGGTGQATVTGNRAIEHPPADAVAQTALRVVVVDDLSESGYELSEPFGNTVGWRLRGLGPFQIMEGDAIERGANLSLFLKKVSVNETEEEQIANAWCAATVQRVGDEEGEPVQLKATADERAALPDVDEESDAALTKALHPHRYRLGGAAALKCATALAELVATELDVEGPPSAPDAAPIALPEEVPPLAVAQADEPAKAEKRKRRKRKRKKRSRKKRKRKKRGKRRR